MGIAQTLNSLRQKFFILATFSLCRDFILANGPERQEGYMPGIVNRHTTPNMGTHSVPKLLGIVPPLLPNRRQTIRPFLRTGTDSSESVSIRGSGLLLLCLRLFWGMHPREHGYFSAEKFLELAPPRSLGSLGCIPQRASQHPFFWVENRNEKISSKASLRGAFFAILVRPHLLLQ